MRWHNNSLEQENAKLRSRLSKSEATSKAIEDEIDRVVDLEEEITFLQNRVHELEKEKELVAASPAPRFENPPTPPTDSRGRSVKSATPARRSSSKSGRLGFLKFRIRGSLKEISSNEIPPLPSVDDM
jgi:regulator of replication initiation timing